MSFLQEQKQKLEQEKKRFEKELRSFAKQDPHIKGNWETKFPDFGTRTADLAEEQDQIEEYQANLPIEHTLELELQKINKALENIKKKTYGACEKCGKKIKKERLEAYPEADLCIKCAKT